MPLPASAGFTALYERLDRASAALRERGCLLQSIARRYYVVYTLATYLAAKYGIAAARRRDGDTRTTDQFTHNELPDVVRALYTGRKSGNVGPGTHSGIVGAILSEREAVFRATELRNDRMTADYRYTASSEQYDAAETDARLARAHDVIVDLRSLL